MTLIPASLGQHLNSPACLVASKLPELPCSLWNPSGPGDPQGSHSCWLLPLHQGPEAAKPRAGSGGIGGHRRGKAAPAALPRTRTWLPTSGTAALQVLEEGINAVIKTQKHKEGNTEISPAGRSNPCTPGRLSSQKPTWPGSQPMPQQPTVACPSCPS